MKYSIIIPHFTKEGTTLLERAVRSIPVRDDVEIIVVDNSPVQIPHDSLSFDNRAKIYYSDNKKGAGHARNVGLEHARGEWVLFLDADDFYTDDAFTSFDKYTDTEYDIVFFKFCSVYSDTLEPANRDYYFNLFIDEYLKDKHDEDSLRYRFISPCSKLIKMSLIKANNIVFEEIRVGNDVMFSLKTGFYAKTITADAVPAYCATINRGSLINTASKQTFLDRFLVKIRANKFLKDHKARVRLSVMSDVVFSLKYGFNTFCYCLKTVILTGNVILFKKSWFKTIQKLFSSKKDKTYIVNES